MDPIRFTIYVHYIISLQIVTLVLNYSGGTGLGTVHMSTCFTWKQSGGDVVCTALEGGGVIPATSSKWYVKKLVKY